MSQQYSIKIALVAIFLFLILTEATAVLNDIFIWLNTQLAIRAPFIIISVHILLGLIAGGLLIVCYNRFLKGRTPSVASIFILFGLMLFITVINIASGILSASGLVINSIENYAELYTMQHTMNIISSQVVAPSTVFIFALIQLFKKEV